MNRESQEPIVRILQTIGNPIRKATIEALKGGGMKFSQLLAACDLDYDHDAGHFYYHLSELMNKRIVKKVGDTYTLTEFGSKIAEMLASLQKECSFLFVERNRGERKVDIPSLETEWIEFGKEVSFEKKAEKGRMWVSFHRGAGSLQKRITKKLPDGPERRKLIKFLEEFRTWKGPQTLLAKDKDMPLGWADVSYGVSWGDKPDKETGEPKVFAKTFIIIDNIAIASWTKDRKKVAMSLLEGVLNKAKQVEADAVQLMKVNAEDSKVIEALRDLGFERVTTSYAMKKRLS